MKNSLFNIVHEYNNNEIWIYNTLTTSVALLKNIEYTDIFINHNYSEYDIIDDLCDMGFIVSDDFDELNYLSDLRNTVVNSNNKIADLIIAPTMDCDARCYYCFEHGAHHEKMSIETAKAVIDYICENWNNELFNISWFGGEPLLATDIMDFISDGLRKRNVKFISKITTNGYNLTLENIEKALHIWNTNKIQISIDAYGAEYNRIKSYIHQDANPFETVISNLKSVLDNNIKVRVRINFNPKEQEKAKKLMLYLQENFGTYENFSCYFAPIDAPSHIVPEIASDFKDEKTHPYMSMVKFASQFGYYTGNNRGESGNFIGDNNGLLAQLKLYPSPTNCYASCPSVFSIDSKGDIYKCHRVLGKGVKYSSGNIKTGIIKNDIYNFFCNTDVSYDECNTCKLLPICQGGCKINAYIYKDEHACIPIKSAVIEAIEYYISKIYSEEI